jgi:phage terminase small subunit
VLHPGGSVARTKPTPSKPRKPRRPAASPADLLAQDDAAASAAGVALSAKMQRFVVEYAVDGNGSAAAIRAGYSAASSRHIAWTLLRRPAVRAAIAESQAEHAAGAQFARDALLRELANVAYASLRDIVDIVGGHIVLKKGADIPPEVWPAIAEISEAADGRIRIKMHPKMQAIDFLGRVHKMWEGSGAGAVKITVRLVRELGDRSALRLEPRSAVSGG